ncbi:MAG: TonB-dependent receptor [Kiritimatiellia bacterium]|jgi:iron complex outermembrane receptor protein|nr:TonB-dependent receptor [Pseudomonadales bacterium]MDP7024047.1 TonB-dependent receptor [Kiritimatiellia bacterium]|tara:strand:- start:2699 stop:5011 length:2313 start_codon:yes stop_codon:yes gene_type:complete
MLNLLGKTALGATLVLCVGLPVPTALAAADEGVLEEIIVTARKREESLQDLAMSVSALGAMEIEANFATDIRDLIYISPNTVLDDTNQGPGGVAAAYIRGIGVSEVEKNFDPAVGVVVDGVFLGSMSGSITRAIDLERVEVARGPQGTLFGRNTIGGVIKLERSKPTMTTGGKVRVGYGDYDTSMIDFIVNFGNGENYGLKLTGSFREQDEGFFDNVATGDDEGRNEYTSLGANFLWIPADGLELEWTSVIEDSEEDTNVLLNVGQPGQLFCDAFGFCSPNVSDPVTGDRYKNAQLFDGALLPDGSDPGFNHNGLSPSDTSFEADTHQLEIRWDINDSWRMDYIGASWETEEDVISDWDAVAALMFHTDRPAEYEQTTHELRFTFDGGGKLRGTVGAYYWDSEYEIRLLSWIGFAIPGVLELPQFTNQESESWAVFFEGDYDLTDQLMLTLGARYTEDDKTTSQRGIVPCGQDPATFPAAYADIPAGCAGNFFTPISNSETWNEFTPKVALTYRPAEDYMFYGSYSRGFRAGGFNGRVDAVETAIAPYDPETVDNYEIGYRSEWANRTLTFNATAFYMEYDDKQEEIQQPSATSGTGQVTRVVNASNATIQGLELELAWLVTDGFTLRANLGLLDAEYDDFDVDTGTPASPNIQDFSNLDIRRAPDLTLGVNADYQWDIGPGSARAWIGWRYLDNHEVDFANKPELTNDSQNLIDISLTYEYQFWYASVFGRNIGDEDGYQIGFDVAGLWSYAAPRAPRTWGVEIGMNFE